MLPAQIANLAGIRRRHVAGGLLTAAVGVQMPAGQVAVPVGRDGGAVDVIIYRKEQSALALDPTPSNQATPSMSAA
jgi:hypothetical protein